MKDLPKLAARARFEPTTLWSKGVISTNAPPSPTMHIEGRGLDDGGRIWKLKIRHNNARSGIDGHLDRKADNLKKKEDMSLP